MKYYQPTPTPFDSYFLVATRTRICDFGDYKNKGVMLDNGAYEDCSVDNMTLIMLAQELLNAGVKSVAIIAPDQMKEPELTNEMTRDFLPQFYHRLGDDDRIAVYASLWADTPEEAMEKADLLNNDRYPVDGFALPKHLPFDRVELARGLRRIIPPTKIHVLGINSMEEFALIRGVANSFDTTLPIKATEIGCIRERINNDSINILRDALDIDIEYNWIWDDVRKTIAIKLTKWLEQKALETSDIDELLTG